MNFRPPCKVQGFLSGKTVTHNDRCTRTGLGRERAQQPCHDPREMSALLLGLRLEWVWRGDGWGSGAEKYRLLLQCLGKSDRLEGSCLSPACKASGRQEGNQN